MNATVDEALVWLTGIPTFGEAVIEDPPSARADHEGENSSEVVAVTPNEAAATLPNEWEARHPPRQASRRLGAVSGPTKKEHPRPNG